jgi:Rhs element Vgr protein
VADSPLVNAEGVIGVTIFSDGTKLADESQLISLTVTRAVNRVPAARLVFSDGDMPNRKFPLSDAESLTPGTPIRIAAGYGDDVQTIFEGIVVKHSIRIGGENEARLLVECRDKAVKMTIGRKNATYSKMLDSAIIANLISAAGLTGDVTATSAEHTDLVQYYVSDWDFVLSRAEANGLLVIATDGALSVKAPDTSGEPTLEVTYGADLIGFEAEIDARTQFSSASASTWSPSEQAEQTATATPPQLNQQGNLDAATLAGVIGLSSYQMQTGAAIESTALDTWVKALQMKAGLARIRGTMSFQGSPKAKVGTLIKLVGVGARFSGDVFVGAVTHEIEAGQWITTAEFGVSPTWFTEQHDVMAPAAAGLLPGIGGLHVGKVTKLDGDPDGQQRVQVSIPVLGSAAQPVWARLLQFYASNAVGAFFVPEVDDEVVLGFFDNDPTHPVILGSLYSSNRAPPYTLAAENNTKALVTRCKSKIEFDEENKVITVITPGKNKIVLSDQDKSILLLDQNNNRAELNPSGITLDSPKDIKVKANGTITLDAVGAINISSQADVKSSGLNVLCEGQVGFTGKGSATAELSASGETVVRGAMVMIN